MKKCTDTDPNVSGNTVHFLKPLAPKKKARKLESFSVTTDSVVATANLVVDESHKIIEIWWGDERENEQPETIYLLKERLFLGSPISGNTLKLQHAYTEGSIKHLIVVRTQDKEGKLSWNAEFITLEPRYKFIVYPVKVEATNHSGSSLKSFTKLHLNMKVTHKDQIFLDESWELITRDVDVANPPPPISSMHWMVAK